MYTTQYAHPGHRSVQFVDVFDGAEFQLSIDPNAVHKLTFVYEHVHTFAMFNAVIPLPVIRVTIYCNEVSDFESKNQNRY